MIWLIWLTVMAEPSSIDWQFAPAGDRIQLVVAEADKPWNLFLEALFRHVDRDANQTLSAAETARLFALPLPAGSLVQPNFAKMDSNSDNRVTLEEFKDYYRRSGFAPVVGLARQPDPERELLASSLLRHFDQNQDGTISSSEWQLAPRLMRRLDDNEDERLEPAEINSFNTKTVTRTAARVQVALAQANPVARLAVELGDKPTTRLEGMTDQYQLLHPNTLKIPGGQLRVNYPAPQTATPFRTVREFYLAQFTEALGNKAALTTAEIKNDPDLSAIAAIFPFADRNGDGRLSLAELEGFLDLIALGLQAQVLAILEDSGATLFDLLDTNHDGRLDVAELRSAADRPPLKQADIPSVFELSIARRSSAKSFGPVPIPAPRAAAPPRVVVQPGGPDWFLAMDRNGDGFVSQAEFRGSPERFAELDTNRDGRISRTEAERP